jgi:hypothetical protein
MANVNSSSGIQNLPAQSITTGTATALLVPAQGLYSTLPSPTFPAGTGLWTGPGTDIAGSAYDGHVFKVRVAGKFFTGASSTFLTALYQVPATIVTAGTSATAANDQAIVAGTASSAVTGAGNFVLEATLLWDSVSQTLGGFISESLAGGALAGTIGTVTTVRTVPFTTAGGVNGLNFIPFFTFGTANAANTVTVTEFFVDRA